MLTPQEASARAFQKASFGGYNMAMVDEFMDQITTDYSTLYKENALLKVKVKSLDSSIEDYRSTEGAMRKALLAAQQMADDIIKEAEDRKAVLLQEAETEAMARSVELAKSIETEEKRLRSMKEETTAYVSRIHTLFPEHAEDSKSNDEMTNQAQPVVVREPVFEWETTLEGAPVVEREPMLKRESEIVPDPASLLAQRGMKKFGESRVPSDTLVFQRESISKPSADVQPTQEGSQEPAPKAEPVALDPEIARRLERFSDLKFGRDFEIT